MAQKQNYLDDLALKVDENGEPHNKGYAFAIATKAENVTINGEPGYSEKISWTPWDYTKRARGPKQDATYYVNMKNNNLGAEWINVATYKNDRTITPNTYKETTIAIDGNGVKITPTGLSDNTVHNGLLKVLRDYKHYVQVLVTRENSNGQVITASFADDEENMYAYREITFEEFAHIVSISIGESIYNDIYCASSDSGYNWTFNFRENGPYMVNIKGTMTSGRGAWLTGKPHTHGAGGISTKAIPTTLEITQKKDVEMFCTGKVYISGFSKDGHGEYKITFKNKEKEYGDIGRQYIPFRD